MESPVDIVITIQEDNELPKVIQKLLHDLGLLLESFENSSSAKKIRVHRVDVNSAKMSSEVIDRYKITEANLIMVASPRGDKKIVFRHEELDATLMTRTTPSVPKILWHVNRCGSQVFTENGRKLQTLSSNQRFSGEKRS